jgi:hypothetical protein
VDILAVSMTISHSLKTWDIYAIVYRYKTAHFKVADLSTAQRAPV